MRSGTFLTFLPCYHRFVCSWPHNVPSRPRAQSPASVANEESSTCVVVCLQTERERHCHGRS